MTRDAELRAALRERGRRSFKVWRTDVVREFATATYRQSPRTAPLEAVIADPSWPIEEVLLAALIVSEPGTSDACARLRRAALACEETKLRIALQRIADDDLDDDVLDEVLRAPRGSKSEREGAEPPHRRRR